MANLAAAIEESLRLEGVRVGVDGLTATPVPGSDVDGGSARLVVYHCPNIWYHNRVLRYSVAFVEVRLLARVAVR